MPEDILYVKDLIEELKQMNPLAEVWIQREDKIGSIIYPVRYCLLYTSPSPRD